jgi:hypothetical protein
VTSTDDTERKVVIETEVPDILQEYGDVLVAEVIEKDCIAHLPGVDQADVSVQEVADG